MTSRWRRHAARTAPATSDAPPSPTALDRYDVRERHEIAVAASPERAFAAGLEVRAASDPLIAGLFRLRGIRGGRLALGAFITALGFTEVGRTDRSVSAVWDVAGLRFAFALWADPGPEATRLMTETRVLALSRAARVRFRLYWLVVGPFSGLIRRRWLTAAKRLAESGS